MPEGAPDSADVELAEIGLCPHDGREGPVGEPCPAAACRALDRRFVPSTLWEPGVVPPERLLGTLVGDEWLLVQAVGKGGLGRVYLALQQPHFVIKGALKLLDLRGVASAAADTLRRRFFVEHAALARLEHPNVVRILRYGYHGAQRQPYLVMEYISGGTTLGHRLDVLRSAGRRLARGDVRRCLEQMLGGLQAAHGQGVVHGDIKPSNIMAQAPVDPFRPWYLRLVDFGASKFLETPGAATGVVMVTPRYMAPEQLYARDLVGPETDLYAVTLMACLLLRLEHPFSRQDAQHVCRMRSTPELHNHALGWLDEQRFATPLRDLLRRGLSYEPGQRFPHAAAYARELARVWEAPGEGAREPISSLSTSPGRRAEVPPPERGETPEPARRADLELSREQLLALWGTPASDIDPAADSAAGAQPEHLAASMDGRTRPEQVMVDRRREPTEPEPAPAPAGPLAELDAELTQQELVALLADIGGAGEPATDPFKTIERLSMPEPSQVEAADPSEPWPPAPPPVAAVVAPPPPLSQEPSEPVADDSDVLEVDTVHIPVDQRSTVDAGPPPAVAALTPLPPGPPSRGLGHLPTMQLDGAEAAAYLERGVLLPEPRAHTPADEAGAGPGVDLALGGLSGAVWSPQLDDPRVTQPFDVAAAPRSVTPSATPAATPAATPSATPAAPPAPAAPEWNWGAPPGSGLPLPPGPLPLPSPRLRVDSGPRRKPASAGPGVGAHDSSEGWLARLLAWLRNR